MHLLDGCRIGLVVAVLIAFLSGCSRVLPESSLAEQLDLLRNRDSGLLELRQELAEWVPDGHTLGPVWMSEDRARYHVGPMTLYVNRVEGGWTVGDWNVECQGVGMSYTLWTACY